MRSFDVIISGVNRSDSRLRPTQFGAVLIPGDSACFPGDPGLIVTKVNRFGFLGWRFKQSVYVFAPGLKSSRNHKALRAAKFNQMRLDGEPHNPSGPVFVGGGVNARDELTQRQRLLLVIDLHGLNIGQETARALWGVSLSGIHPIANGMNSALILMSGWSWSQLELGGDGFKPDSAPKMVFCTAGL